MTLRSHQLSCDRISHLTLAEVYAALTYDRANTAEVENDLLHQGIEAKHLEAL